MRFSICDLPNNPIYIRCNYTGGMKRHPFDKTMDITEADRYLLNPGVSDDYPFLPYGLSKDDVITERTERGITLKPSQQFKVKYLLTMFYIKQTMGQKIETLL